MPDRTVFGHYEFHCPHCGLKSPNWKFDKDKGGNRLYVCTKCNYSTSDYDRYVKNIEHAKE